LLKSFNFQLVSEKQFNDEIGPAKSREWENIITCHAQEAQARTWSFDKKAKGRHVFTTSDESPAKCSAISYCGHFGFIGSSKGSIDVYNMQSGLHRKTFDKTQGKPSKLLIKL
jgi:U3 small nucleolar RNA-associated protein 21